MRSHRPGERPQLGRSWVGGKLEQAAECVKCEFYLHALCPLWGVQVPLAMMQFMSQAPVCPVSVLPRTHAFLDTHLHSLVLPQVALAFSSSQSCCTLEFWSSG